MNAIVVSVVVMVLLSVLRVHVVLSLFIGALVGGLLAGLGLEATMVAFQDGLARGSEDRAQLRPARRVCDTVMRTFLHFNLPLLAAGRVAAMVL